VPYYLLGVAAIFVHVAAFLALKLRWHRMAISSSVLEIVLSIALIGTLTGAFHPIDLPVPYALYLDGLVP
jgi:multidrug transporter EmrE-like cation transporter